MMSAVIASSFPGTSMRHGPTVVYDWCTEGFDTADLQEARALLEALS